MRDNSAHTLPFRSIARPAQILRMQVNTFVGTNRRNDHHCVLLPSKSAKGFSAVPHGDFFRNIPDGRHDATAGEAPGGTGGAASSLVRPYWGILRQKPREQANDRPKQHVFDARDAANATGVRGRGRSRTPRQQEPPPRPVLQSADTARNQSESRNHFEKGGKNDEKASRAGIRPCRTTPPHG